MSVMEGRQIIGPNASVPSLAVERIILLAQRIGCKSGDKSAMAKRTGLFLASAAIFFLTNCLSGARPVPGCRCTFARLSRTFCRATMAAF